METHAELLLRLATAAANNADDPEYDQIRDMLIVIPPDNEFPYVTYSCTHWQRETRLCTIYDQRPRMCSNYPYDSVCRHCGMVFACGADEHYQTRYPLPRFTLDA